MTQLVIYEILEGFYFLMQNHVVLQLDDLHPGIVDY